MNFQILVLRVELGPGELRLNIASIYSSVLGVHVLYHIIRELAHTVTNSRWCAKLVYNDIIINATIEIILAVFYTKHIVMIHLKKSLHN